MPLRCLVVLLGWWAFAPGMASAAIRSAHVSWLPSPALDVAGYNIYVRQVGDTFSLPINAGLALPLPGNQRTRLIGGLDDTREYMFAVTAYLLDGSESGLSNEIALPARTSAPGSCDLATVIPARGGTVTGTTTGSGSESGSCGATAAAPERVFAWTPAASGTAILETCNASATTFDTILYVRGERCDGPELACSDDAANCPAQMDGRSGNHGSRVEMPVVAGTTYYVIVDAYGNGRGDFSLTVTPPVPDPTCGAILVPPQGGTFSGTTSGTGTSVASCEADTARSPERVYRWTPTVSGTATIQTCNANATTFDTVLSVRGESCTGPELACNDDAPDCTVSAYSQPGSQGSRVQVPVVAGTTYFIVVDGYGGGSGDFSLTVTPPVPSVCGDITIPAGGGVFTGTTTGSSTRTIGSCGATEAAPGRIYAWTPSASGIANIQTCNASATTFDTILYVRSGTCTGLEVACSDDAPSCPVSANDPAGRHGSRVRPFVFAGATYYIVVDGYGGASGDFSLSVAPPGIGLAVAAGLGSTGGDGLSSALAPQALHAMVAPSTTGCTADTLTEGAGCETGDSCDVGVCRASVCTPTSKPLQRPPLDVKRLALHRVGSRVRVVTRTAFASTTDPGKSGVLVDLNGPDGGVLYRLQLPGTAFRANRARTRFRYVRSLGRKAVPKGVRLRRLSFRRAGDRLRMFLRASVPDRLVETALPRVDLAVRVGSECAHAEHLLCTTDKDALACDAGR